MIGPNPDVIRKAVDGIRQVLRESGSDWIDADAIRRLKAYVDEIRTAAIDSYVREKSGSLMTSIEELGNVARSDDLSRVKQNVRVDCSKILGYVGSRT